MNQKKTVFFAAKPLSWLGLCLLLSSPEVFAEKTNAFPSAISQAQQEIQGTIRDGEGNPISGATVLIKGTTKATSSDTDGAFSIDADVGDIIVFRNLGYKTQEITISALESLSVTLETDNANIDEVVVVGMEPKNDRTLPQRYLPSMAMRWKTLHRPIYRTH